MKSIFYISRYLMLLPVTLSLLSSAAAFVWGAVLTFRTFAELFHAIAGEAGHFTVIELISVMDVFLIATALLIFAIGLYELFIGEVDYPEWLIIRNIHDLKSKLASVIILVMAVAFLEHLAKWENGMEILLFGAAITLVTSVLIAFTYFGKEKKE